MFETVEANEFNVPAAVQAVVDRVPNRYRGRLINAIRVLRLQSVEEMARTRDGQFLYVRNFGANALGETRKAIALELCERADPHLRIAAALERIATILDNRGAN